MKMYVVFIGIALLLWGCETIDKQQVQRTNDKSPFSNTYRTDSGKLIHLVETQPQGASLSDISIHTEGFEHNLVETISNSDPISNVFVRDLDKNGFDEIYIITTSAGSGAYGDVIAFASNKDKSLSTIYLPEIERMGHANQMLFNGYRGHDQFYIENNFLVREFPVYNQSDANANPSGNIQKILYRLYAGEAGWILKIE